MKKNEMKSTAIAEPDAKQKDKMDDYEMDSCLDTLHKAHCIKKDAELMAKLQKRASEKMESIGDMQDMGEEKITSIKGIRNKANKMAEYEQS